MLKKFFISVLGTITGIWISVLLIIFGGIMLLGVAIAGEADNTIEIKNKSILYLKLSGEIKERYNPKSNIFEYIQETDGNSLTLNEMLLSLKTAAKDSKIEGLYIDCQGASMGMASREELISAIREFKESGKWIYAYADSYSQGDYIIATEADRIFLNPLGSVDIHGIGGAVPFFKGALDKLGVKMQIIKVGTFKSAVEPYILTSMSEPARLQMQQYIDSLWNYCVETVSTNRSIAADSIRRLSTELIATWQAPKFIETHLADSLCYRREMNNYLGELTNQKPDELRTVSPSDYLASAKTFKALEGSKKHVAVLYAVGDIVDSGEGGIVGETMVPEILKLADNEKVMGMVLRVNSPGGSAFASEQIWEALNYFKSKGKPLYVSMGDYAASGGYYISCGADCIFADPTTITGSIGVFGMIPEASELINNKLGIHFSTVESNPNAVGPSLYQALSPAMHAALQRSVENTYDLFTSRVAAGRHMSQDSVKLIAEGRVWVGSKAKELGLVDKLGDLEETISAMAERVNLTSEDYIEYPSVEDEMWLKILRQYGGVDAVRNDLSSKGLDSETMELLRTIKKLRTANPIQARMEQIELH